jgi:hypothetical protein
MTANQQPGEPVAWESLLRELRQCAATWEPQVVLLGSGNLTAARIVALCDHFLPHPRPRVGVTEAMVEAFLSAYAKCELYNGWTFTHRMGVRAGIRAALADSPAPPANGGGEVARG